MGILFQNHHRHTTYTNPKIADSTATNRDYAERAKSLGHGIISTCEHGWQGRYIEGYELAKEFGLKFVFGVEAYWVNNRFEKDRSNCHIYIGAKNENGRRAINKILSEANLTGFYGVARIDKELIFSLPKDDVIITTACLAFWKYDNIDEFVLECSKYFTNFYLEVQYHNTEKQIDINKHILELNKNLGIPIIMGCDSHYIYEEDSKERDNYILSRGISYDEEDGWYLDYPDGETAIERFVKQGVLTEEKILECIDNTNVFLSVEEYDCPCFNKEIKMPSIFPDLSQEEKDAKFTELIWNLWDSEKKSVQSDKWKHYEEEIKKEIDTVIETKHADYFLDDFYLVSDAKKHGGIITPSGRGSAVSFYINKLLGFTKVDRISAEVKMYPERFMSKTRILEAKSIADLDLNLANPEVFLESQTRIFGEGHSFPMLAYGTLKPKAAWKMYARAKEVDFKISNDISSQIEKYETAKKHLQEDEKDSIDILDYIEKKYHEMFSESTKYQGVIDSYSIHPCASLIYDGDIVSEIGLIKIKDNLCCVMDGLWAEKYKFLKNDLLKVNVVKLIDRVFKKIGIEMFDVDTLIKKCTGNQKVWDVYKKSSTMGINQVEQRSTKGRVAKYAPENISELCAFIAAIRPGFKTMYPIFESRAEFVYGIKSLDELIQTPQMQKSFILYQEIQMAVLNYAGIPMVECYEIIKSISKKRIESVLGYKNQFLSGFKEKMIEVENQEEESAEILSQKIWKILEDSSHYSFNSSHSYCVAVDSLYGAYLKSTYPIYFYSEFLKMLEEDGDKDRLLEVKEEAQTFYKIKFPSFKFRQDNREISIDEKNNSIMTSLKSIKGFGTRVADEIYLLKDKKYDTFIDLLYDLFQLDINKTHISNLIKIEYFSEFGNAKELFKILKCFEFFNNGKAKTMQKNKIDSDDVLYNIVKRNAKETAKTFKDLCILNILYEEESFIKSLNCDDFSIKDKIINSQEILGNICICTSKEEDRTKLILLDIRELISKKSGKLWKYCFKTMSIGSGKVSEILIEPNIYSEKSVKKYDVIKVNPALLYSTEWNGRTSWNLKNYEQIIM